MGRTTASTARTASYRVIIVIILVIVFIIVGGCVVSFDYYTSTAPAAFVFIYARGKDLWRFRRRQSHLSAGEIFR